MGASDLCVILLVAFSEFTQCAADGYPADDSLATEAMKHLGSTEWSYFSHRMTGRPGRKCNIFVAEMILGAGGEVPLHSSEPWLPLCAAEWSNTVSGALVESACWEHVITPRRGDVASYGGHVGIVTGPGSTIAASAIVADSVIVSDWGFRQGHNPVFWRYTCPWNPQATPSSKR